MSTTALATTNGSSVAIDYDAVLKTLNLNPKDPKTQALLLVCQRYELDPVLKHIVLISGNAYVTRDGYLAVAHRSGQFDGMEVVDEGETPTHYTAKVSVYRKDMGRPFTYTGRFPKAKSMAKEYGPEMAIKVAEVMAMRRAFNVTGLGAADERWDDSPHDDVVVTGEVVEAAAEPVEPPPAEMRDAMAELTAEIGRIPDELREQFIADLKSTYGAAKDMSLEQLRKATQQAANYGMEPT